MFLIISITVTKVPIAHNTHLVIAVTRIYTPLALIDQLIVNKFIKINT
jgi:hypothetical protein